MRKTIKGLWKALSFVLTGFMLMESSISYASEQQLPSVSVSAEVIAPEADENGARTDGNEQNEPEAGENVQFSEELQKTENVKQGAADTDLVYSDNFDQYAVGDSTFLPDGWTASNTSPSAEIC